MFNRVMTLQQWLDNPTFQFADTTTAYGELNFQYRFSQEPRRGWRWRRGTFNPRYAEGRREYRVHVRNREEFIAQLREEGIDLNTPVTETTMW